MNLAGQVVAINTVIMPTAHGIGFAIPVNGIKPSVRELVASGRLVRPSLGVMAISVTPQLLSATDLPVRHGALVLRVESDVPEQPEGVRPGDVILGVTGRSVRGLRDLRHVVSHHRVGGTIAVTVWRDGQPITVQAVVR
ncbi:MAG: S1C family serine protease [Candidatus Rokuibacteriota bacterium]